MSDRKGVLGLISNHTSLDVTRPGDSLRNWFIGIPLLLSVIFGITIEGNPISKFASSIGNGARRAVGATITENQPMLQEGANSLYGTPTQPGDLNKRQFQNNSFTR
ncbi:MAG: hypothetical protein KME13_24270 [Myxacorys californica WJT36-NPBG1]|nr:hypothetical protein [Myxacorys californica WJT36-NPBG1]